MYAFCSLETFSFAHVSKRPIPPSHADKVRYHILYLSSPIFADMILKPSLTDQIFHLRKTKLGLPPI